MIYYPAVRCLSRPRGCGRCRPRHPRSRATPVSASQPTPKFFAGSCRRTRRSRQRRWRSSARSPTGSGCRCGATTGGIPGKRRCRTRGPPHASLHAARGRPARPGQKLRRPGNSSRARRATIYPDHAARPAPVHALRADEVDRRAGPLRPAESRGSQPGGRAHEPASPSSRTPRPFSTW